MFYFNVSDKIHFLLINYQCSKRCKLRIDFSHLTFLCLSSSYQLKKNLYKIKIKNKNCIHNYINDHSDNVTCVDHIHAHSPRIMFCQYCRPNS